jgi:hypothetical protein
LIDAEINQKDKAKMVLQEILDGGSNIMARPDTALHLRAMRELGVATMQSGAGQSLLALRLCDVCENGA